VFSANRYSDCSEIIRLMGLAGTADLSRKVYESVELFYKKRPEQNHEHYGTCKEESGCGRRLE
jgi:hypothetical protein